MINTEGGVARIAELFEQEGLLIVHMSLEAPDDDQETESIRTLRMKLHKPRSQAVETSSPLVTLLQQNRSTLTNGSIKVVHEPFESIDLAGRGWERAFDLVFVSMCPVLVDWASVERVLSCAKSFCYMSLSVGSREHSLVDEVWPLVTDLPRKTEHLEMYYLTQLLLTFTNRIYEGSLFGLVPPISR